MRHGPGFYDCSLQMEVEGDGQCRSAVVCISEDDQGLAAGQFAAFYEGSQEWHMLPSTANESKV